MAIHHSSQNSIWRFITPTSNAMAILQNQAINEPRQKNQKNNPPNKFCHVFFWGGSRVFFSDVPMVRSKKPTLFFCLVHFFFGFSRGTMHPPSRTWRFRSFRTPARSQDPSTSAWRNGKWWWKSKDHPSSIIHHHIESVHEYTIPTILTVQRARAMKLGGPGVPFTKLKS